MPDVTHGRQYVSMRTYDDDKRVVWQEGCYCGYVTMPAIARTRAKMDLNEHLADPDGEPGLELGYGLGED